MHSESGIAVAERMSRESETDRDLERRVMSYLAARHVPGLRYLAVQATNGVVTVSGQVLTFYEKQLCNQCCRRVAGVLELVNAVSVMGTPAAAVA
jgi:osmotically-inducible protein OsmY